MFCSLSLKAHGHGKLFTNNFTAVITPYGIMAVNLIKEDEKAKNEKEKYV